jgi:hypothetical protein
MNKSKRGDLGKHKLLRFRKKMGFLFRVKIISGLTENKPSKSNRVGPSTVGERVYY